MAVVAAGNSLPMHFYGEGKEWHKSHSEAVKRAEEMRIKKLKSLDKQMKKMSSMVFG